MGHGLSPSGFKLGLEVSPNMERQAWWDRQDCEYKYPEPKKQALLAESHFLVRGGSLLEELIAGVLLPEEQPDLGRTVLFFCPPLKEIRKCRLFGFD